jgi:hypothetical protein
MDTITTPVVVPELTPAGMAWVYAHPEAMIARVAVAGNDWPAPHRRIAVQLANNEGAKAAA